MCLRSIESLNENQWISTFLWKLVFSCVFWEILYFYMKMSLLLLMSKCYLVTFVISFLAMKHELNVSYKMLFDAFSDYCLLLQRSNWMLSDVSLRISVFLEHLKWKSFQTIFLIFMAKIWVIWWFISHLEVTI